MPNYEVLQDLLGNMKGWSVELPSRVSRAIAEEPLRATFGERHGSWFLEIKWMQDELVRTVELAFTNPRVTDDAAATTAIVTVRASATSSERFVIDTLYERRRSVPRLSLDELEEFLISAGRRAREYGFASLTTQYDTGRPNVSRDAGQ